MMKLKTYFYVVPLSLLLSSVIACSSEDDELALTQSERITIEASTSPISRIDFAGYDTDDKISLTWSEDDAFQLYTDDSEGKTFTHNGTSTSYISGVFNGEVVSGATAAFYPASKASVDGFSSQKLDVLGQRQVGNNSNAHLSEFNFMSSEFTATDSPGIISFSNLTSQIYFKITLPSDVDANVTEVSFSAPDGLAPFVVQSTVGGEPEIYRHRVSLSVQSPSSADSNQLFLAYMAMLPCSLTADSDPYTITVTTDDGNRYQALLQIDADVTIEQKKVYTINARCVSVTDSEDYVTVNPVNSTSLPYATCGEVPEITGVIDQQSSVLEYAGDGYAYTATFVNDDSLTYVVHTTGTGDSTLRNYSLLYDKNKRAALWVAYVMQDDRYPDNEVGRKTSWHYDPAIPEEDQPDLTSSYTEFNGISFDRGHQVASNSRQASINQNKETYYFTNMTPQVAGFNRGKWSSLETKEQGWDNIASADTLFIVTGPVFNDNPDTTTDASGNLCSLPSGYYKVIAKATFITPGNCSHVEGVGFYFPTTDYDSWDVSNTSIDAIEAMTGFDFFANLPSKYMIDAEMTTDYAFLE